MLFAIPATLLQSNTFQIKCRYLQFDEKADWGAALWKRLPKWESRPVLLRAALKTFCYSGSGL
jgi:hypothetical protein